MKSIRHKTRMVLIQALYCYLVNPQPKEAIISFIEEQALAEEEDLFPIQLDFFNEIFTSATENLNPYAYEQTERSWEDVNLVEKAILLIAHVELSVQRITPYKVIINEAVELAKVFGSPQSYRFINSTVDKMAQSQI